MLEAGRLTRKLLQLMQVIEESLDQSGSLRLIKLKRRSLPRHEANMIFLSLLNLDEFLLQAEQLENLGPPSTGQSQHP